MNIRTLALGCALGTIVAAAPAAARTDFGMNIEAGASAGTNPFLLPDGSDDASAAGTITIQPTLSLRNSRSALTIGGVFHDESYVSNYGSDLSGSVSAGATHRISELASADASVQFLSSRTTLRNSLVRSSDLLNPTDPATVPNTGVISGPLPDPTLAGLRIRTDSLRTSAGLNLTLSPRDTIIVNGGYGQSWTDGRPNADYRYGSGGLVYKRQLSGRTAVSATFNAITTSYLHTTAGDGYTLSPGVGLSTEISSSISLSVNVGATLAHTKLGNGTTSNRTALSASFNLCRTRELSELCLFATRSVQPTSLGGISTVTAAGLDYSVKMSARNSVTLSANYNRTDQSQLLVPAELPHYMGAEARFNRTISERLQGFVTAGVEKTTNTTLERPVNFRGAIGLGYKLGTIL